MGMLPLEHLLIVTIDA